jgi:hypothetical protein
MRQGLYFLSMCLTGWCPALSAAVAKGDGASCGELRTGSRLINL